MSKTPALLYVAIVGSLLIACDSLPRLRVLHDPLSPEEHVTLGRAYELEGRPELAVREYGQAISQQPASAPALVGLGNLAFVREALAEAESYYLQAIAVAPADPVANNNLAMLYLIRRENLDEAARLAVLALQHGGPLRPYVLDTLAHIYFLQGRHLDALRVLKEAEASVPVNDQLLHERLAQLRHDLTVSHP